jgi:hypothetical protein
MKQAGNIQPAKSQLPKKAPQKYKIRKKDMSQIRKKSIANSEKIIFDQNAIYLISDGQCR